MLIMKVSASHLFVKGHQVCGTTYWCVDVELLLLSQKSAAAVRVHSCANIAIREMRWLSAQIRPRSARMSGSA